MTNETMPALSRPLANLMMLLQSNYASAAEREIHAYARAYAEQRVKEEREACAIACIAETVDDDESWQAASEACAEAIRARGKA